MSRQRVFIVVSLVAIGVVTSATRTFARVIHCGSIELEVPDTWRARGAEGSDGGTESRQGQEGEGCLGSWEAFAGGNSYGYLTVGVVKRFSLVSPTRAIRNRREVESHLRGLPCVKEVRVTEFATLEVDGVPAYRARYTLETHTRELLDQSLYIVGGTETCFLAFTRATSSLPPKGEPSFEEIMHRARVRDRALLLGPSRESSMAILAVLAGSSLLYHMARGRRGRPVRRHGYV